MVFYLIPELVSMGILPSRTLMIRYAGLGLSLLVILIWIIGKQDILSSPRNFIDRPIQLNCNDHDKV